MQAKASADSARDAAEQAKRTAEASLRSAAAAEATIVIDFDIRVLASGDKTVVLLTPSGANVFIPQIELSVLVVPVSSGGIYSAESTTNYSDSPMLVHASEPAIAVLEQKVTAGSTVWGRASVRYSLDASSTPRQRTIALGSKTVELF